MVTEETSYMQAYLFDFDGTLVDSAPDLTRALDHALARAGLPGVGLEDGKRFVGHGALHLVTEALRKTTGDPMIAKDSPLATLVMSVFLELYEPLCTTHSVLYPNALDTLRALRDRGHRLGLVTNKPRRFVDLMLPAFELDSLFDTVVAGDDLATKKPDPEMVHAALSALGVPPSAACLVGDSRADLGAAKQSGVSSVLVSFGYCGDLDVYHAGADRVIESLSELLQ